MAEAGSRYRGWLETLAAFRRPQVRVMLFLGFSAGLPLLLIFSSLSLWLREAGVERSAVTFFSWAALGYSFKFVWAPLVDRLPLPLLTRRLGRRRGWLLLAQLSVMVAIAAMAATDPAQGEARLIQMALAALMLGFASATQDIVIDAYRIESAEPQLQAMLSASYIAGYRTGMLLASSGALALAAWLGTAKGAYVYDAWRWTYLALSGCMFVLSATAFAGVFFLTADAGESAKQWLTALLGNAPLVGFLVEALRLGLAIAVALALARLLLGAGVVDRAMVRQAYLAPVQDFFTRYGGPTAWLLLALVGVYRISDIVLGVISNVFYQDLGFDKTEIATVVSAYGLLMTLLGGFLGGLLTARYGVIRILFLGALLSAATNLLFWVLAHAGRDMGLLYLVISADNLSAGLASAAFVAFLSSLTSISFTAVQYAVFSSLMTLLPKLLGGYSGTIVEGVGYPDFFVFTTLIGMPVLWLVHRARGLLEAPSGGPRHVG
jgi:PAT family beta-lactamase induction signal transducer AmpG